MKIFNKIKKMICITVGHFWEYNVYQNDYEDRKCAVCNEYQIRKSVPRWIEYKESIRGQGK